MAERYFAKFPTIEYANTKCVNITKRPIISDDIDKNPTLFHKYTLKTGARPDILAENYYQDPFYEWLIFLNNKIVDPYYGWYLNEYDFKNYIEIKYGSVANAQERIIHYQLNWPVDTNEITASYYNNTLPSGLKKYYTPNFGQSSKIISYRRKQDDFIVNTNKIISFDFTVNTGNAFLVGEIVDIKNSALSLVVGGGEVVFANSSVVKIQHVSGNTAATNKIVGETSNTIATITKSTVSYQALDNDEAVYWSPVYYYEYEIENNEKNKNIRLLHSNYSLQTAEELRTVMKE